MLCNKRIVSGHVVTCMFGLSGYRRILILINNRAFLSMIYVLHSGVRTWTHLRDSPVSSLTDIRAFAQSECEAEALQAAVRVDHHICGGIIRVGVLRCGKLTEDSQHLGFTQNCQRALNHVCLHYFSPWHLIRVAPETSGISRPWLSN